MSEKKFTPGPWVICYDGQINGNAGAFVCSFLWNSYKEFNDNAHYRADAKLIAAAPDLYDALADVRTAISRLNGDVSREVWYSLSEYMVVADNALAKARGEA